MGGSISVYSEVNVGSTFNVILIYKESRGSASGVA